MDYLNLAIAISVLSFFLSLISVIITMKNNSYKSSVKAEKYDRFGLPVVTCNVPMPKCKPPKTDFNEMCADCFGEVLSKMSTSKICNLAEVEKIRMDGCVHNRSTSKHEPDLTVKAPDLDYYS